MICKGITIKKMFDDFFSAGGGGGGGVKRDGHSGDPQPHNVFA